MDSVSCKVTQKNYLRNLDKKIVDDDFKGDTNSLLRPDITYDIVHAYEAVKTELITKIK